MILIEFESLITIRDIHQFSLDNLSIRVISSIMNIFREIRGFRRFEKREPVPTARRERGSAVRTSYRKLNANLTL